MYLEEAGWVRKGVTGKSVLKQDLGLGIEDGVLSNASRCRKGKGP